ncbi:MAG: hypothetical protein JSV54_05710 [Chloroflexota bacterium]|nr:MAG: hypothetical protein JSV54_05710 [Chloroflexota bacterium]
MEYARNVSGIRDAAHLEYEAIAGTPLIVPVSCPVTERPEGAPMLWGKLKIKLAHDSLAFHIYQRSEIQEAFNCNYGLNPRFRKKIEQAGLQVTGVGENGEARIVELNNHCFFLATGFQPQLTSQEGHPHPLIVAYLGATKNFREAGGVEPKI